MAFRRSITPTKLFLIPLIIIFSITACNLPAISGGEEKAVFTSAQGLQAPTSLGFVLGFVLDPRGNPVPNASLTGGESSDLNGLLMSTTKTYAEEWAVVEATVYATGFAQAKETVADAYVFNVRLTPISTVIWIDTDANQSIGTGELSDPEIAVLFPQGAYNSLPVLAGLAELNPIHIGPLFAPLSTGQKLHLQRAFALQVLNGQGEKAPLTSGKTLEVMIRDGGQLSDPITMASFDPEQGHWQVLTKSCTRRDETHILCEVDQVSPLIGLFTDQDYLWMPDLANLQTRGGGLPGLMAPMPQSLSGELTQMEGTCDGPVAEAIDEQLMSYEVVIGDFLQQGANLNSGTMASLMNNFANLAFAFADLCKNEKGKRAVLGVVKAHLQLGLQFGDNWGYDPSRAIDKIEELTIEAARKVLAEGKCVDVPEALNAVREARLLGFADSPMTDGGTETIDEAFDRKMKEWSQECDLWRGTIRIMHFPEGAHLGLGDRTVISANNVWTETHDIRISTHPETHAITGRSKVTLAFPSILYAKVGSDDPCDKHSFIAYYGFPSEKMEVNTSQEKFDNSMDSENQTDPQLKEDLEKLMEDPQNINPEQMAALAEALESLMDPASQTTENSEPLEGSSSGPSSLEYGFDITFSGFYDGTAFSILDLEYNCYAEIRQYIYDESEEDDECIVAFEASIPVHNYSSYLAHGFYGSPPITLQEILETPVDTVGDLEIIRDSQEFSNPQPEIGSYPFMTTHVIWDITHIQNQDIK
jgi:hypothetical protein